MRTLGFCLFLLLAAGCATVGDPPLTAGEVVALSRDGKSPQEIIGALQRTNTVIPLSAADYVVLHDEGVADEVLNYLQSAQIEDALWRERSMYWNLPGWGYYGVGSVHSRGRR